MIVAENQRFCPDTLQFPSHDPRRIESVNGF